MRSVLYIVLLIAILASACSQEEARLEEAKAEATTQLSRDSLLKSLKQAEKMLLQRAVNQPLNSSAANAVISLYENFMTAFPNDSLEPSIPFKAGELALNTNRSKVAIDYFLRITRKFPNDKKTPHALYLAGFIYDSQLNEDTTALKIYDSFLKKYPDHQLVETVLQSKALLGMNDKQVIRSFEKKSK